jgi:hypothetical protein
MHHEALMVVGPIDRREVLGYLSFPLREKEVDYNWMN